LSGPGAFPGLRFLIASLHLLGVISLHSSTWVGRDLMVSLIVFRTLYEYWRLWLGYQPQSTSLLAILFAVIGIGLGYDILPVRRLKRGHALRLE